MDLETNPGSLGKALSSSIHFCYDFMTFDVLRLPNEPSSTPTSLSIYIWNISQEVEGLPSWEQTELDD